LVAALKDLRETLAEHTEKRVTVLTLMGRLNDANQKALRRTIDDVTLQIEYNAIRSDLSVLIQSLEESDFDNSTQKDNPGQPSSAKQGSVLYRIPDVMQMGEESHCIVRIAVDESAIVEEIVIDNQVVLKDLSRISDLMQVELADPAREPVFKIRTTSSPQQLITDEGFSQWSFYVEPLRAGVFALEVKVSVLEMAFNQIHCKELVFRESVEIVTTRQPASDGSGGPKVGSSTAAPQFKNAGPAFAFSFGNAPTDINQPSQTTFDYHGMEEPAEKPKAIPNSRKPRTAALLMALVMLGSTATWALTPAETRDWWLASIVKDDETAYTAYLTEHPQSKHRETAMYKLAERSQKLSDLQAYQKEFGRTGKFHDKVSSQLLTLENKALEEIKRNPSKQNIQQFAADFNETEKLPDLKEAIENRTENRTELLSAVEDAYVKTAGTLPTEKKIKEYLKEFPQGEKLDEINAIASRDTTLKAKIQAELEDAYIRRLEKDLTPENASDFIEKFPEPIKRKKFEELLDKKPALRQATERKWRRMQKAKTEE
jgi:hypothetical protein